MQRHIYDHDTGEYLGSVLLYENPEEPDKYLGGGPRSLAVAPPHIPAGHAARLNTAGDGWDLVEDHRGQEGWLDGQSHTIVDLGPLPAGWLDEQPIPPDTRTPEEKRQDAYAVEADPLFMQAQYYEAEAAGFRLLDDLAKATVAEEKSREYLRQYALKKEEIRSRFPDPEESS